MQSGDDSIALVVGFTNLYTLSDEHFLEIKLDSLKIFHLRNGIMATKLISILGINIQLAKTFLFRQG